PQEVIESITPVKAGTLQQVTQVGIQMDLEYLQRRRLHNLSGQPVPAPHHALIVNNLFYFSLSFLLNTEFTS
ncbi:hypothetical protein ABN236_19285, partial [Proteus sp. fly-1013]|uniref:hypothetical protein n=1 Tax=Proteus sp. fly-1013 TaxID=3136673 RepID=UPI0032DA8699